MKIGSGLAAGPRPEPTLAAEAVRQALAAADLDRAGGIILLLTHDFARQPQAALLAAARAGDCLDIGGCTASGLLTERGWLLDQSGAAALVFEAAPHRGNNDFRLGFCSHGNLPADWDQGRCRSGLVDRDGQAWAHARLSHDGCTEIYLPPGEIRLALSPGLQVLGSAQTIDESRAYDLVRIAGQTASENLRRSLPPASQEAPPWHQIVALRDLDEPGIPILSANHDGSLTLASLLDQGDTLYWAIRQPLAASQEMQQQLAAAADRDGPGTFSPDCALMFSCIGRGPLFYGSDDHDLQAFCERFPGTPLLGAYGSGQIAPTRHGNRLFHHAVTTLLFESLHV